MSLNAVKELREKTGAGLLDCQKALGEASGDVEKALLRHPLPEPGELVKRGPAGIRPADRGQQEVARP